VLRLELFAGDGLISETTVKRHLYNAFGKLGAVSRIDAVNKYYNRQPG
jgi:DNA-binding CsgD family transcriptional regulator